MLSGTPEAARFSAVARFGNCTASAIRFEGSTGASPAYVLTAGHCLDLSATDVIVNRADATRTAAFRYRVDVPAANRVSFRSRRILYSTMKGVDFALIELDASQQSLTDADITPLTLSGIDVSGGEQAQWAGVPSNSIPSDEIFLRTSSCTVSGIADLVEWRWLWRNMLRHDCSDIFGGASGSPLISTQSGLVIGVITTGNVGYHERGGDFECWRDNPCEVTDGGYIYHPETSYAAPVSTLAGCHDSNGVFSLTAPSCGIDPGVQAKVVETDIRVRPGSRWNASVSSDTLKYFRYKVVKEGFGDCRTEDGYGAPQPITANARIQDPLPSDEGRYHLCIVAGPGETPDSAWQPARFATVVHVYVDNTPPQRPPDFSLLERTAGFGFVPDYAVPDISLILPKGETGPNNTCDDRSGYRMAYPVPFALPDGAVRLCLIAADLAGNESSPYAVDLNRPSIFPAGVVAAAGQERSLAAPGAWVTIKGVNLAAEGVVTEVILVDAAGKRWSMAPAFQSSSQVNALLPDGIATGVATVSVVKGGEESNAAPVLIQSEAPGLFTPDGVRYGVAAVSVLGPGGERRPAFACSNSFCNMQPIPAGSSLVFVAGGLAQGTDVSVQLSGVPLDVVDVSPGATAGTFEITTALPAGFSLRGYLPATLSTAGLVSTPVYLRMR